MSASGPESELRQIANDLAKYFAIVPAMFAATLPWLKAFDIMQLHSANSAILSAVSEAFASVQPGTRPLRVDVLNRGSGAADLGRGPPDAAVFDDHERLLVVAANEGV